MDLSTIVDLSQVVASLTVVGGMALALVQDLAGGIIVLMWHRLEKWLEQLRVEQGNPSDSEWFQWLAEQLERRKLDKEPAYVRHREWTP